MPRYLSAEIGQKLEFSDIPVFCQMPLISFFDHFFDLNVLGSFWITTTTTPFPPLYLTLNFRFQIFGGYF